MLLLALLLQAAKDEPRIETILKPDAAVAVVRFVVPKDAEPGIESDAGPESWLTLNRKGGWGILRLAADVKELKIRVGDRRSKPAAVASAATLSWKDVPEGVTYESQGLGRVLVRNRSRVTAFAIVQRDGRPIAAAVLRDGEDASLDAPRDAELLLLTDTRQAWRGAVPVSEFFADSPLVDWEPVRPFEPYALSTTAGVFWTYNYNLEMLTDGRSGVEALHAETLEYRAAGVAFEARLDMGLLEFSLGLAHARGDGEGRGDIDDGVTVTDGTVEFDIETWRISFFVGRRLGGLHEKRFSLDLRVDVGVHYLIEEIDNIVIHPYDVAFGDREIEGPDRYESFVFAARGGIEGRLDLGKGWSILLTFLVEGDLDRGLTFDGGLGILYRF